MIVIECLIAFFALFLTDIFWSVYIRAVAEKKALKASIWATALFIFGAIAVVTYAKNPLLIGVAAAGAFCGTYISFWSKDKKENNV